MKAGFIAGMIFAVIGLFVGLSPDYLWWHGVLVWFIGTIVFGWILDQVFS